MASYKKDQKDYQPTSLIEILLESDIYNDEVTIIANDVILMMMAATDTSRNGSIIALSHLMKNSKSKQRVRDEIRDFCDRENIPESETSLNPSSNDIKQFTFLQNVIKESFRFNPPVPNVDDYEILEDITVDGITIKKGTLVKYNITGLHHNPNEW